MLIVSEDMFLLGQLEHGVYNVLEDDVPESVSPREIAAGYGVDEDGDDEDDEDERLNGMLQAIENELRGAGSDSLEDDEILRRVRSQLKHSPVKVPRIHNPFFHTPNIEIAFWEVMSEITREDQLPTGYGFLPGEHGYGEWNCVETIAVGKRTRGKEYKVTLPRELWEPRVRVWAQAVEGLQRFLNNVVL